MVLHTRDEVIKRSVVEFERLDSLVANLTEEQWKRLVPRPETKDAWTVKDALAHITFWKADSIRRINKQRLPPEMRGLGVTEENRLVFERWHDRPAQEVLAWHRQVQHDLLAALKEAPEQWFSGKQHSSQWPYDLDGHSAFHRVKDIERAVVQERS